MDTKNKLTASEGRMSRLVRLHAGRSWARLTIYLMALMILAPISITFELLSDFFDSAAEWVNDLGNPLQKWAYFRKPNDPSVAVGRERPSAEAKDSTPT